VSLLGLGLTALLAVRRFLVVVTVHGASMEPTFHHGDRVLVRRHRTPRAGQIVVVKPVTPGPQRWLIKRVASIPGDPVPRDRIPALIDVAESHVPPDRLVLLGDNAATSYDSRQTGYFPTAHLLGVVVRRLKTGDQGRAMPPPSPTPTPPNPPPSPTPPPTPTPIPTDSSATPRSP
jgi:signal peptidase I